MPRSTQRMHAQRWAEDLDVWVNEGQMRNLWKKRLPKPWVAKRFVQEWGEVMVRAANATRNGGANAWRVFLSLPRLALGDPARVKERCRALLAGGEEAARVVQEALAAPDAVTGDGNDFDPLSRAERLAMLGQTTEALRAAYEAGAEEVEEDADAAEGRGGAAGRGETPAARVETPDELVGRMLPTPEERQPASDAAMGQARAVPRAKVQEAALKSIDWGRTLRSLKPGKAAAADGWRNEHFLSAMGGGRELARRVAQAVATMAEGIFEGLMAPEVRRWFNSARIAFISKADGTPRALGIVGVLRRMVARAAVVAVAPGAADYLVRRGQFGVGAPAGTEALARTAQEAYERGCGVLVLDRVNAYPRLVPDAAKEATVRLVPVLGGLLEVLLGGPALLCGQGLTERLFHGLFMGCPASPLLYAVATEAALDPIRGRLGELGAESRGYLDDGTLAAWDPGGLETGYGLVREAGVGWGQVVHPTKTKLLVRAEDEHRFAGVLAGIPRVNSMTLVGVPVGEGKWRSDECVRIVERTTRARRALARRLPRVAAYYMLRKADGFPKICHMLRGVPAALTEPAAIAHDVAVEDEMAQFAGTIPRELGRLRGRTWLPLRLGGAAVASARLVAGAAYAAATVQVKRLQRSTVGVGEGAITEGTTLEFTLARESGRPAPSWTALGSRMCKGQAQCRMPAAVGCAREHCAVCCAVLGACRECTTRVGAARAEEEVRSLLSDETVRSALGIAAREAGEEARVGSRVEDAFAVAAAYRAPQRALTCALLSVRFRALKRELDEDGRGRELRVWRACARPEHYAAWLILPVARLMPNATFLVAMRREYALHILNPESLRCRTAAGFECKKCPLEDTLRSEYKAFAAANPFAADDHALVCKAGGCGIHTHDGYVESYCACCKQWGVPCRMECRCYLPGGKRMDSRLPLAGDPGTVGLCVDFTRRHGGEELELRNAERHKEEKYLKVYQAPVTMRGAAFNDFGVMGKQAMDVMNRTVAEGVMYTGSHPADLKLELLARLSCAVMRGNAAAFAYFAEVNGDREGFAPRPGSLVPNGRRTALGVTGRLSGQQRGRGRPRKTEVQQARSVAPRQQRNGDQ